MSTNPSGYMFGMKANLKYRHKGPQYGGTGFWMYKDIDGTALDLQRRSEELRACGWEVVVAKRRFVYDVIKTVLVDNPPGYWYRPRKKR